MAQTAVVDAATGLGYVLPMAEQPPPQQIDSVSFWASGLTRLVRDLGLSTVMLGAVGYGFWRTIEWFGKDVAKPVVERHLRYLDKHEQQLDIQILMLKDLHQGQKDSNEIAKESQKHILDNAKSLDTIIDQHNVILEHIKPEPKP